MTDICIENAGSIVLVRPMTPTGKAWVEENVEAEDWQHFGGAIAAEPRTVQAVVDGARGDGLEVSDD
jgi:hypothetical protein